MAETKDEGQCAYAANRIDQLVEALFSHWIPTQFLLHRVQRHSDGVRAAESDGKYSAVAVSDPAGHRYLLKTRVREWLAKQPSNAATLDTWIHQRAFAACVPWHVSAVEVHYDAPLDLESEVAMVVVPRCFYLRQAGRFNLALKELYLMCTTGDPEYAMVEVTQLAQCVHAAPASDITQGLSEFVKSNSVLRSTVVITALNKAMRQTHQPSPIRVNVVRGDANTPWVLEFYD